MDSERRAAAFVLVERSTELPMLVLSLLFIPVVALPWLTTLPPGAETARVALEWLIWAAFALELAVKTYLAPARGRYLLRRWFDVLIVVVPFLRPLRIAQSARALRALSALRLLGVLGRTGVATREVFRRHGLHYTLLAAGVLFFAAAGAVTLFERGGSGSIQDFGTALWWAAVTVTTVGYGDTFPVTPEGRGVGVFLMFVGITLFGLLTANIAAFFIESIEQHKQTATLDDVMAQLRRLEEQIAELRVERAPVATADRVESDAEQLSLSNGDRPPAQGGGAHG